MISHAQNKDQSSVNGIHNLFYVYTYRNKKKEYVKHRLLKNTHVNSESNKPAEKCVVIATGWYGVWLDMYCSFLRPVFCERNT